MGRSKVIYTEGYRGTKTNHQYLPKGEYIVGDVLDLSLRTVPRQLADHMVEIGKATVLAHYADQEEPSEPISSESVPLGERPTEPSTDEVEATDKVVPGVEDDLPDYEFWEMDALRDEIDRRDLDRTGIRSRSDLVGLLEESDRAAAFIDSQADEE